MLPFCYNKRSVIRLVHKVCLADRKGFTDSNVLYYFKSVIRDTKEAQKKLKDLNIEK